MKTKENIPMQTVMREPTEEYRKQMIDRLLAGGGTLFADIPYNRYAMDGRLFEDGGDTERDKLWQQVYNSRGSANLPYEQAKDYDVKYYPDGTIMPMTYEEWVQNIKGYTGRDGILPDNTLAEELRGTGYTLGQAYDAYRARVDADNTAFLNNKNTADLNTRRKNIGLQPLGRFALLDPEQDYYEKEDIITLPDPSGPEGIQYNDQRAKYRMMTEYENLTNPKIRSRYWINNWQESPEYRTQDARYIDYRKKKGMPFRHYADGSLKDDGPVMLFADGIDKPVKNSYGETWYPLTEEIKNNLEETGSSHHYWLNDGKGQEYIAFSPEKDTETYNRLNLQNLDNATTIIHELGHSKYPDEPVEGVLTTFMDPNYTEENGTEIAERDKQVLNWNGINTVDSVQNMNGEDLRNAYIYYLRGIKKTKKGYKRNRPGDNNSIKDFLDFMDTYGNWDRHMEWVKGDEKHTNIFKLGGMKI